MMSNRNTADQALVRELNLSLVLRFIHNQAPVSRSQIAQATGLNKSTVSSLVHELLERRLIHETGINSGNLGRPAIFLEINPQAGAIIGLELGVDFMAIALTDFSGSIFWRKTVDNDPTEKQETIIADAISLVQQAVDFATEKDFRLLGLGISAPGPVDIEEGLLIYAPNLQWENVPLQKIFFENCGIKVFVENDANAAAIGEHLFGAARQVTDFIIVFIGVGIGGGLFLNGKLYRGKKGFAGEIGHSPILAEPINAPCRCGNHGCWEAYANQHAIIKSTQALLDTNPNSIIPTLMAEQDSTLSIPILQQAADMGDSLALEQFSKTGMAIGQGIASLIKIFNPEKIILGGPLSTAGDYLLPSIKIAVAKHIYPIIKQEVEVKISNFGPDASLIGAVAIVVEDAITHPVNISKGGDERAFVITKDTPILLDSKIN